MIVYGSMIASHTERKKKVHFDTLMDTCHLKNVELESQYQKYKGRVVIRGDIVQDAQCGTCDVADDFFCLKASLREAPLTSNHSGYGSNTTNQVEDRY